MDTNKNLLDSKNYYNSISSEYFIYREQRKPYLDKVDSIIINDFRDKAKKILDVGAGDGLRGVKIFKNIQADVICLVEESNEMATNIKKINGVDIFVGSIQQFNSDKKFDIILCLWNVLGHVKTFNERISILKLLKSYLSENGVIVIDFNNRYNYIHYGITQALRNIVKSIFKREAGWFIVNNRDGTMQSPVYIHNYFEIKNIILKAGLHIEKLTIIDYDNGRIKNNLFQGQYLFYLK